MSYKTAALDRSGAQELQWRGVARRMLHVWGDGMAWLRSAGKQPQFKGLEPTIEAAGPFTPEPAECAREVIGHSPCLTKRH